MASLIRQQYQCTQLDRHRSIAWWQRCHDRNQWQSAGDQYVHVCTGLCPTDRDQSIWIAEVTGNLNLSQIDSQLGDVRIFADGSILETGSDNAADINAQNITLIAGYLNNAGSIGDANNDLEVNTNRSGVDTNARLNATATRAIYLTELPGSLLIGTVRSTGVGLIRLTLPDTAGQTQDFTLDDSSTLVNDNGDVELRVGDNFTMSEDAVLGATGDVTILADYLNADLGEGVLVDIRNNIDSPTIHIETADDEDQVELSRLSTNRYFVDGKSSTDQYKITLDGSGDERVSVTDSGNPDDGADTLLVLGTSGDDLFLLRRYFLALLQPAVEPAGQDQLASTFERIDYDESINGRLRINALAVMIALSWTITVPSQRLMVVMEMTSISLVKCSVSIPIPVSRQAMKSKPSRFLAAI